MSVWLLCALLSSLICQTKQDGRSLPLKEVEVYVEKTNTSDLGAWVLNVKWRDELKAGNNESRKVSYDMEVYYTEQMMPVHSETIHVTQGNTALHHWKWTSPIPLQCTSHSVRLRRRDQHHISEWTPLYTYKGEDLSATRKIVFPHDQVFMVGSNITFCCILEKENVPSSDSEFVKRISNRTYITKSLHVDSPSSDYTMHCNVNGSYSGGSTVFIGYPPDDHSLTCVTQNLTSVECRWEMGRDTGLRGVKRTIYTLNGGVCEINKCVLPAVPNQVTNWTLIAKNDLGVKILTDTADPTHRVLLRAPIKLSHTAHARSVTLEWSWDMTTDTSFPIICRVMLNGSFYNKTFRGKGLSSIVLDHLQPFANYTVNVSCGSDEHFYKWSEWSNITFTTKEDIPEAVDVWFEYFNQNTYVLWKPLNQQQSHGIITQYELTKGKRREIIGINTLCYNVTTGNERSDQNITVSAKNSAGLSPPTTIIVPGYPDNEVHISRISSRNGEWEYFNSTCGYVVEWFPTYTEKQCTVQWTKIPESEHATWYHTWKQNGIFKVVEKYACNENKPVLLQRSEGYAKEQCNFTEGEKYTVSVYACNENKPVLLQRSEGYAIEQKPSGTVQDLKGKQNGRNLELYWKEVPLKKQKGFIQGYKVITVLSDSKTLVNTTVTNEPRVNLILDPGTYTFHVSAFTSGGYGGNATLIFNMEIKIVQMIVTTVVGCSAATLVFIIITILCYRKKKWLKKLLYPDIPKPKLAGKWTTKGMYCTQMTEGYIKCEIQEVHSCECPATAESTHGLDLISSNSTLFPAQKESPADVSYYPPLLLCAQKLTSIIENPSYNMTIPELDNVAQISELTLEVQDSYLPAPNFVQKDFVGKDSACYKPQSA
ncbi:LIF receptor subunit alpha b [Megalobrama amblycephala]|uniref:LIF receptor subunit alpha b n=1 Tax=Megalobrama amblycephala TaxID=75352 RepID=UPI002014095F|nr:LIF receptor subunit alpha b [Megalobrama amblycephala]XP_048022329.1 LIF receptor subunit alpha b [Megalobrama amblycephala]